MHSLLLTLYIVLAFSSLRTSQATNFNSKRHKRYLPLIFPNPAAITYITGFGIPVHNLNPELVTVGMVFKAQQFLPNTNAALRQQANHSIHKREWRHETTDKNKLGSNGRNMFYKALEQLSISLGQTGQTCVLKMICDVASKPFHYMNGVVADVMQILLTPSSSNDANLDYVYIQAEVNGRRHMKCNEHYPKCNESLLEQITNLFD